jgi:hypothetical protein
MTRDLAILISPDQPWMNTQAFLSKLDENLQKALPKPQRCRAPQMAQPTQRGSGPHAAAGL